MDMFVSRKRPRLSGSDEQDKETTLEKGNTRVESAQEEESTDVKLAILASLHPERAQDDLLEVLLSCEGSVEQSLEALSGTTDSSPQKKRATAIGVQSALSYTSKRDTGPVKPAAKSLTKRGRTLHLYSASDIAAHTPCSIIHNFLPPHLATALLRELLPEVPSYTSATFKLFDNVVQSPHTACFYVTDRISQVKQKEDYLYNGSNLDDVRQLLPVMRQVSDLVKVAVNQEIKKRIASHYPQGKKLKYQSPKEWQPNAAFVNCYDGAQQNVGYHSDQLSYLGPRAVIGSLSLGVAREFRVRRIVPPDEEPDMSNSNDKTPRSQADIQGQISIHLPHNSLLVMHAEMQEEWKHSIAPAQSIDPHPVAGNKRINITYRWYREEFHPNYTPRCRCGVPTVLKCVQKRKETRGRYMWMCQVGGRVDPKTREKWRDRDDATAAVGVSGGGAGSGNNGGCGYFEWAEFSDDGDPIWKHQSRDASKKGTRRSLQSTTGVTDVDGQNNAEVGHQKEGNANDVDTNE